MYINLKKKYVSEYVLLDVCYTMFITFFIFQKSFLRSKHKGR